MSANDVDDALQRLNYFNGERLAASDFRAEQAYHMGMRRVLNRSLYSPGIVTGLEVEPSPIDKHHVIVRRGLAFDHLGREIFLPVDVSVQVWGAPSSTPGVVFGNLLVVSYREMRKFPAQSRCMVGAPYQPCSGDLAWGAPTRIVADAVFEFLDSWPSPDSGKIVLSQVELTAKCEVVRISVGVRKYAVQTKPQITRPLSLEGEKDIDSANSKILYFHVDGGYPETATLYLRGRTFSTLYYTELGSHTHVLDIPALTIDIRHTHSLNQPALTQEAGEHRHGFWYIGGGAFVADGAVPDWQKREPVDNPPQDPGQIWLGGKHQHGLDPLSVNQNNEILNKPVPGQIYTTGMSPAARTTGKELTTLADLVIKLNNTVITERICDQLEAKPKQAGKWKKQITPNDIRLNGSALNAAEGTGEIDLLKLGIELAMGQNKLEFLVSDTGVGGNLQYNLYVG